MTGQRVHLPIVPLIGHFEEAQRDFPSDRTVGVAVLGATGSIGRQACRVLGRHPELFDPVLLAAGSNVESLVELARDLTPPYLGIFDPTPARREGLYTLLQRRCGHGYSPKVLFGREEILTYLREAPFDVVLNAVVGFQGLEATLAVLESGKRLALANKESLVAGGELVRDAIRKGGGSLLPVDSEHAAAMDCLAAGDLEEVETLWLTCSGGPFRGKVAADLRSVGPREALAHPTWSMGPKITVDSATLMNKGLEVIEAHYLFGFDYSQIRVVVHPQSVVHAAVTYRDGSSVAHMAAPDMENPILRALAFPRRVHDHAGRIEFWKLGELTFEEPDLATFRCLDLAYRAGRAGGAAPAVLNASNEVAVAAFLREELNFLNIADVVEDTLSDAPSEYGGTLEGLVEVDAWARRHAEETIEKLARKRQN